MRKIKFRAWEGYRNKMILDVHGRVGWSTFLFHTEVFVLMQYTGLKDKNGVEIYESDFVLCPEWEDYDKGIMGMVKREVRWDNSDACFAAFLEGEPDREGYMLDNACNMEVIGNIYENPELLKGE